MSPDGAFRDQPALPPLLQRVGRFALIVAVIAGGLGVAALALWFALILIPIAAGAALLAYLSYRLGWRPAGGPQVFRFGYGVDRWRGGPPSV